LNEPLSMAHKVEHFLAGIQIHQGVNLTDAQALVYRAVQRGEWRCSLIGHLEE
jgi:hypothetical protein